MALSFDYILAGVAAATIAGAGFALSAYSQPEKTTVPGDHFTRADYAAFDRGFEIDGEPCDVGLASRELCFDASPLEPRLVEGEPFPDDMYPLALEWRANLELQRKLDGVKTVRIGRTVALVDRDTHTIVDTMRLGAQTYAGATGATAG